MAVPFERRACPSPHCYPHSPSGAWNPGDVKSVGGGVMEMRVDYGPGYRIYYVQRGAQLVVLLCGGDKHNQRQDVKRARDLVEEL